MPICRLPRSVLHVSGEGVGEWLASLITNALSDNLSFAALLTPQGKIIADFFVFGNGNSDSVLIDVPNKFLETLEKRLKMYRLRKPIKIFNQQMNVYAAWGEDDTDDWGFSDPRLPALGRRHLELAAFDKNETTGDYNAHRLSLGVPDSEWDFETAKVFPADANMDLLNGVNFSKGCFVGQEVVSRMKRMTTVKKRMRGIIFEGNAKAGDRILSGERVIGDVLSTHGKMGMAMMRLDRLRDASFNLTLNDAPVQIMSAVDGLDH